MTDAEYQEAISKILESGRGYTAIVNLAVCLEIGYENATAHMREMNAERTAIRKICKGKTSDKNKVSAVLSMCEDMRGEQNDCTKLPI